jgi:hypothetical protein
MTYRDVICINVDGDDATDDSSYDGMVWSK